MNKTISLITVLLFLAVIFAWKPQETKWESDDAASEIPAGLIGYTELRTDLPGGRQANVSTMRATVVQADGTGKRRIAEELAADALTATQFTGWSPDGKLAIVGVGWKSEENATWEEKHKSFRHESGKVRYDSYLTDFNTGVSVNMTAVDRVSYYNSGLFFWPGDSTKLGFSALINGNSHPFKMDCDGRNKRDLTSEKDGFTYGFNVSPDGNRVVYHKDYQVYLAGADGSGAKQLSTGNSFNFGPQWSPDGKWVLFLSGERNTNCDPYLVRSDGSGLHKLASRNGYKGSIEFLDVYDFHEGSSDVPVWAADGKSVFFTAQVGDKVELFQIVPGHKAVQLTSSPAGTLHYHPNPSKDGRWLLYGSRRNGVRQLFLRRLKDQRERQITDLKRGTAAMWAHWQPTK